MVPSTQVADARVEYRSNARIDKAEMMAILTRFFLSVMPL
jgi:flagellar L-ring protein precursor FlgH